MKVILCGLSVLSLMSLVFSPAIAAPTDAQCTALSGTSKAGATVSEAVVVAAAENLPAYCRVSGVIEPNMRFQFRLPTEIWNRKFFQAGCGGFCGDFNADKAGYSNTINEALRRGYAAIIADYGHAGGLADATWAVGNETAIAVYAETGIPKLHAAGTALVEGYYGTKPRRSYFSGCSNGGRLAAMAAQRYPDLFDGILAGAPVLNLSQNGGLYGTWVVQRNTTGDGGIAIGPTFNAKLGLLRAEVVRQCPDATDAARTLIVDPRACAIDAEKLPQCAPSQDAPTCFTAAERATLDAWYSGPRDSAGRALFHATPPGSEQFWPVWLTGTPRSAAVGMALGRDYMKLAQSPSDTGPALDSLTFDFDRDPPRLKARGAAYDAVNPDLGAFRKSGGKLIMYHGWADPVVLPYQSVAYYDAAAERNGGLKSTQDFFRLFMIAGIGHCWELPAEAPDTFDPIAALEDWVEKDKAPSAIPIVQQAKDGSIVRRGTLRPYPLLQEIGPPMGTGK